jgi:helix-hairpin-helix protein
VRAVATAALLCGLGGCVAPWSHPSPLDVNNASLQALSKLPGVSNADAERIVSNRPYYAEADLVHRRILTPEQYDRLRDRLVVGKPGKPEYLDWVPPTP